MAERKNPREVFGVLVADIGELFVGSTVFKKGH
jgi:hypothetical protein